MSDENELRIEQLKIARYHLDEAIKALDETQRAWSESVSALHNAELRVRDAKVRMKDCYRIVEDILNGHH